MAPKQKQTAEDPSSPIYFYSMREQPYGIFSQFAICTIKDSQKCPNVTFNCAEQYMMYNKAQTFHSPSIASQILTATSSSAQKILGREIKDFNEGIWDAVKFGIVERGNYLKFSQNEKFKKVLLGTGERLIVEAAANDKIWGIGYNAADAKKVSRKDWGQNLLGKVLMNVREKIRAEEAGEDEEEAIDDSVEEVTVEEDDDDEADEESERLAPIPHISTANKKRKHSSITKDQTDETSKPRKTPSKKARMNTSVDVNKGLHQILNRTKVKHDEDEQTTEDDLLEMLTKKAVEDSMVNGGR